MNWKELLNYHQVVCDNEVYKKKINNYEEIEEKISQEQCSLKNYLLRGIITNDFEEITEVQSLVIPQILNKKNLFVQFPTGTGKTIGYLIPSIQMLNENIKKPQILILTPTIESVQNIIYLGKQLAIYMEEIQFISTNDEINPNLSHVIVDLPTNILNLILSNIELFSQIKTIIFDCIEDQINGDFYEYEQIINILKKINSNSLQLCLFSTTNNDKIIQFVKKNLTDHIEICKNQNTLIIEGTIKTFISVGSLSNKFVILKKILNNMYYTHLIIYTNSNEQMEKIYNQLVEIGYDVYKIDNSITKYKQNDIIDKFFKNIDFVKILITTDLILPRLNNNSVKKIIINYDLPNNNCSDTNLTKYIYRVGNDSVYGKKCLEINFVDESNKTDTDFIKLIETTFKIIIIEKTVKELVKEYKFP